MSKHVLLCLLAACGSKSEGPTIAELAKSKAPQIDALKQNLTRAASVATAPASAGDCANLGLRLDGDLQSGNVEIIWADEVPDLLAGKTLGANGIDPHLVRTRELGGFCQQLEPVLYWFMSRELQTTHVSAAMSRRIDSALNLAFLILVTPGAATRGSQDLQLTVVDLASGTARCAVTVTGHADPSLGVEYYQLYRKTTGEKVGGTQALDKYSQAMKTDLTARVSEAIRGSLHVDMKTFCEHPRG